MSDKSSGENKLILSTPGDRSNVYLPYNLPDLTKESETGKRERRPEAQITLSLQAVEGYRCTNRTYSRGHAAAGRRPPPGAGESCCSHASAGRAGGARQLGSGDGDDPPPPVCRL